MSEGLAPWRLKLREYCFPSEDRRARRRLLALNEDYRRESIPHHTDYFGILSMSVVLLNLVSLALYDPLNANPNAALPTVLSQLDYFFVAFFAFETLLRIACQGVRVVFTKPWNLLDFFIVVSSALALFLEELFPEVSSFSGLRAIRVLRPLRAVSRVPEIRVVINSMFMSLRYLLDVGALLMVFVVSMSCAGLALFPGLMQLQCVRNEYFVLNGWNASLANVTVNATGNNSSNSSASAARGGFANATAAALALALAANANSSSPLALRTGWVDVVAVDPWLVAGVLGGEAYALADYVCMSAVDTALLALADLRATTDAIACDPTMTCDAGDPGGVLYGNACPFGYSCARVANPEYGWMGYDDFGMALLTVLVTVTTENFPQLLWATSGATSKLTAFVFGVVLIVIGTLGVVNTLVALITVEFDRCRAQEIERRLREKLVSRKLLAGAGGAPASVGGAPQRLRTLMELADLDGSVVGERPTAAGAGDSGTRAAPTVWGRLVQWRMERLRRYKRVVRHLAAQEGSDVAGLARTKSASVIAVGEVRGEVAGAALEDVGEVSRVERLRFVVMTRVVATRYFFFVTSALMILMVLGMSVEYYGEPPAMALTLEIANTFFTSCITLEMALRFAATDPVLFFTDGEQLTGVITVAVSWASIASTTFNFPVIRALRLVVAVKLLRYFPTLYAHLLIVVESFRASLALILVISLSVFIFACLGMQLYGGKYCPPLDAATSTCVPPRMNFDSFGYAMLSSFSLLGGDNWYDQMYLLMPAFTSTFSRVLVGVLFVGQYYIGQYVLLNIFIAIMMSATDKLFVGGAPESGAVGTVDDMVTDNNLLEDDETDELAREMRETRSLAALNTASNAVRRLQLHARKTQLKAPPRVRGAAAKPIRFEAMRAADREDLVAAAMFSRVAAARLWLCDVLEAPVVQTVMMGVVLLSMCALALEEIRLAPDTDTFRVLFTIDLVASSVFIAEFCLRVFARGPRVMFVDRKTPWVFVELVVVACNVVDIVLATAFNNGRSTVHVVRVLYTLRPLRILRRSPGIRVVLKSLRHALTPLKDVLAIAMIVYVVYGIMGQQLFAGTTRMCVDDPRQLTEASCAAVRGRWLNPSWNFDNLGEALLSLQVVASLENWQQVLFIAMDASGVGVAPQTDANPAAALFVLSFAVIGGFFFTNFFVSVLVRSYEEEKAKMQRASMFTTDEQETWLSAKRTVLAAMPLSEFLAVDELEWPRLSAWSKVRAVAVRITLHPGFAAVVNAAIVLSIVSSAAVRFPRDPAVDSANEIINSVVTAVYVFEFCAKMAAVHPEIYFGSNWNRFDFAILLTSVVDVAVGWLTDSSAGTITRSIRLLRAARLLRITRFSTRLTTIIKQFTRSLYGLSNVAAFLVLFVVVYSLAAMWKFGAIAMDGSGITVYANFDSFVDAAFSLSTILFGGDWSFMVACSTEQSTPGATCSDQRGDCGDRASAILLFGTFFVLGRYVLLNIFVAIIVESFNDGHGRGSQHEGLLTEEHVRVFCATWVAFDAHRTMRIGVGSLLPLLRALPDGHPFSPRVLVGAPASVDEGAPFRVRRRQLIREQFAELSLVASLQLRVDERLGGISFFDVLSALLRVHPTLGIPESAVQPLRDTFEKQLRFRLRCRAELAKGAAPAASTGGAPGAAGRVAAAGDEEHVLRVHAARCIGAVWQGIRTMSAARSADAAAGSRLTMDSKMVDRDGERIASPNMDACNDKMSEHERWLDVSSPLGVQLADRRLLDGSYGDMLHRSSLWGPSPQVTFWDAPVESPRATIPPVGNAAWRRFRSAAAAPVVVSPRHHDAPSNHLTAFPLRVDEVALPLVGSLSSPRSNIPQALSSFTRDNSSLVRSATEPSMPTISRGRWSSLRLSEELQLSPY